MTDGARVPATEITGIYGGVVKLAMRRMVGKVPDSLGVMWQNPRVLKDMMGFLRKTEKWGEIDPNLGSFATMAAASEVGCSFCLDFGYFMTHNRGLDETKAREVPRWRESDAFSPVERRVMEYAEAMSQTPPTVTDEMVAGLLTDLGTPALLELTARIGGMNLSARTNIALGIRSEEYSAACGLQPMATSPRDVRSPA